MKKTLFALVLTVLGFAAMAKPVDVTTAQRVASTYMRLNGGNAQLTDVTAQTPFTTFYVFTAGDAGFVLVSAQ